MSVPGALHSRQSDEWWTPPEVFDPLHREFGFTIDACALDGQASRCRAWYHPGLNGLKSRWDYIDARGEPRPATVWCNPPYSTVAEWIAKAWREAHLGGVTTVMLINNITETDAWARFIDGQNPTGLGAAEVRFVDGRVYFIAGCDMYNASGVLTLRKGERGPAPKGSAIVVFRPNHAGPPTYSRFQQDPALVEERKRQMAASRTNKKRGWKEYAQEVNP